MKVPCPRCDAPMDVNRAYCRKCARDLKHARKRAAERHERPKLWYLLLLWTGALGVLLYLAHTSKYIDLNAVLDFIRK